MLVPAALHEEALAIAGDAAASFKVGNPGSTETKLGPVVSQAQYDKIQHLIETGIAEGATLVAGGPGRPEGSIGGTMSARLFSVTSRQT